MKRINLAGIAPSSDEIAESAELRLQEQEAINAQRTRANCTNTIKAMTREEILDCVRELFPMYEGYDLDMAYIDFLLAERGFLDA